MNVPALSRRAVQLGRGAMALFLSVAGAATAAQEGQPAQAARLEGEVVDESGAALEGAVITARGTSAISDQQGSFALLVPLNPGEATVVTVLKTGFDPALFEEQLFSGEPRHVRYQLGHGSLSATVAGRRLLPRLPVIERDPIVGHHVITRADLDRTPGAMEDISRAVANLPGVVADPDLLATLFIRGGGPDELITYLDGVPLENPFHLGGFASVFNPMLIESADLWVGVTPPRYEPSLSGALDVSYVTTEARRLRVEADLSIQTAKVRVDAPTPVEGLSVVVAARRSFFELYFAGLRALHLVGTNYVAPDMSEYFARVLYRRGSHLLSATYMRASDGFAVVAKPGEPGLFGFDGGVKLSNVLQLGALRDRIDLGGSRELVLTLAATDDAEATSVTGSTAFARDVGRFEALGEASLSLPFSEGNRLRLGGQVRRQSYDLRGQVPDARGLAPWIALPIVDTGEPNLDLSPRFVRTVAAAFGEHLFRPWTALAFETGARLQSSSGQAVYSVRLASSLALPFATVVKLEGGIATQQARNPLVLDAAYGNAKLLPERSRQVVLGVEQPLPFRALLRVEGYAKWLDRLVVNPDSDEGVRALLAAGQPAFQNLGSGFARGVDLLFLGRTELLSYGLAGGLLRAERTNPLAAGNKSYPAPWDQRLSLSANLSAAPADGWLMSGRATFHTGRPTTTVAGFVRDDANQRYLPVFGPTNGARYPAYVESSLRVERRFHAGSLDLAWYAELLNVTNAQNVFLYTYGKGDYAAGTPPSLGTFNHLPIRPFLGIRGEN
ncbi:MAG TPA: TonB-dependent receptor [Myxococcales bacterium]|nr:TonB-dependent receptor [Myxococcales bacterium]